MPSVSRTVNVTPSPSVVLDYLKDFSHAEEWDPGAESCTREGAGPIAVGTTWHNVSKTAGVTTELTYTLTEVTDDRVVLVGENDSAHFDRHDRGRRVRRRWQRGQIYPRTSGCTGWPCWRRRR